MVMLGLEDTVFLSFLFLCRYIFVNVVRRRLQVRTARLKMTMADDGKIDNVSHGQARLQQDKNV
jgi:hypothetical protein